MPRTTLVAGTTITASWANANVRDQVITPFASASARDSAITVPIEGQYAHLTDTNLLTHYDGTSWVPANNNIVARQILTADSTTFSVSATTDFALNGVVVSAQRAYRAHLHSQYNTGGAAAWVVNFHVDGTQTDRFIFINEAASRRYQTSSSFIWLPTAGTKNLDVRLAFQSGSTLVFEAATGAGVANSRQFWIEDIGPR